MPQSKQEFLRDLGNKYSRELKVKATPWEKDFHKKLSKTGEDFVFQLPIVVEGKHLFILDFYLPDYNVVIELDGKAHYTPEGIKKDKKRTKHLNKLGIKVLRIANSQVDTITTMNIIQLLKSFSKIK